ncbi:hypothetical protein H2201_004191 [Coniosporium apollinis]|uniref:NmrA-like domain-containing protein n=2 Tax=Coniosporium TaxID=2810619 RepID=A0ABQ9NZY5_9PEZI|nr:hypothetical protein H2199_007245 [Cladosporium sp. JES 115]KAJ9665707.1 hypothetical protein H2201_004191 [Coniosporium apollinis]
MTTFKTVALFGANGQIGEAILDALINCQKQQFDVLAFIKPDSSPPSGADAPNVTVHAIDIFDKDAVASKLEGVDVVVSALNGKGLDAQPGIQDAAAEARVKRFYPSEYGMHQIYRKPNDPMGYVHPLWNQKALANEAAVRHPAVARGDMSYTLIGCGDFYNQTREPVWCPWTQKLDDDTKSYVFHFLGSSDEKADYTHMDDFARYLVASLCAPELSENAELNFRSDFISLQEIGQRLSVNSGKSVEFEKITEEQKWEVVENPSKAPKELQQGVFPVDFWFLVKGSQGDGKFWRPPGQIHNHLFPEVEVTTFDKYFKQMFRGEATS